MRDKGDSKMKDTEWERFLRIFAYISYSTILIGIILLEVSISAKFIFIGIYHIFGGYVTMLIYDEWKKIKVIPK